jgi:hypothetical protein
MGVVLRAIEKPLGRQVALKILRPELAVDHRALVRFEHEARAAAALRHPNIVAVHACGTQNGTHYLAMEAIDGPSLAERMTQKPTLTTQEIRRLVRELLTGLSAAHDAGLVHRDVKPSNILLDGSDATVKIADFGLARIVASSTRLTLPQSAIGTAEYMSPEQARGDENIDHRADLYSVGVVLFELLTGRVPFRGGSGSSIIHQIIHDEPPDPQTHAPRCDGSLSALALRLLAKRPDERFPSALAVLEALDGHRKVHVPKTAARRRTLSVVTVLSLVVLLAFGSWLGMRILRRTGPAFGSHSLATVSIEKSGENNTGTILARFGESQEWKPFHTFEGGDRQVSNVAVVKLGPGYESIVMACVDPPIDGQLLFALDSAGRHLWSQGIESPRVWPDCALAREFQCAALEAGELDGLPGDEVVLSAHDSVEYATCIVVLDVRGRQTKATYWHLGHIDTIVFGSNLLGDARPAVIGKGHNNKLDGFDHPKEGDDARVADYDYVPILMVLDFQSMKGERLIAVPNSNGRVVDLPLVMPEAYAFLNAVSGEKVAFIAPDRSRRDSPREETVGISMVKTSRFLLNGIFQPGLQVEIALLADPGGAMLLEIDSQLNLLGCTPNNAATIGRTRDYWEKRYHPIVQNGRFVPEYQVGLSGK